MIKNTIDYKCWNPRESIPISYKKNQSQLLSGIDYDLSQPKSGNDNVVQM